MFWRNIYFIDVRASTKFFVIFQIYEYVFANTKNNCSSFEKYSFDETANVTAVRDDNLSVFTAT